MWQTKVNKETRPSINFAKEWEDQLFPSPLCLIWSGLEKGITYAGDY